MKGCRRSAFIVLAGWLISAGGGAEAQAPEYQLKAELVERFARFVKWPEASMAPKDGPFVVGVIGRDPFGPFLEELAGERTIQERSIEVLHFGTEPRLEKIRNEEIRRCHLLFIASSEADVLEEIVATTERLPILTIADTAGFAARGVLINFVLEGDKLRFEVNGAAVKKSGLEFSSKLLRLARPVEATNEG